MFHIILFQPQLPANTGNIIRLSANTGCNLHIIKPTAFYFDDKKLRRAGLDYHEFANIKQYNSITEIIEQNEISRIFALTSKSTSNFYDNSFVRNDAFMFGSETSGLPSEILDLLDDKLKVRIPMVAGSRCLNLSNTVSIVVYEALRQLNFKDFL